MEVSEFKFNDIKNDPKPFGFHIATINIPISVVLIKRVWKKRRKISKHVLKKSFKKKTEDKRSMKSKEGNVENTKHIEEGETLDPNKFNGDRKWCWDEFERHIGVPKRKDTPPSIATAYIRRKSFQRFNPEAKNLEKPKQKDSVFLTTDKPRSTSKCLCPDRECLCFGTGIIHEYEKIPKNPSTGILKEYLNTLKGVCRKKVNINDFVKKIIEATNASKQEKEEMYMDVILRQELCLSRCINSHVTGELHDIKYSLDPDPKKKIEEKEKEEPKDDEELDKLLDDQVCNVVDCTVSTQTYNAPDGELIMGPFSHLLYSNNQETFLKDIRGKKLQISHYTHVSPKPPDLKISAKNMEKLLNFKEMKDRLFKLISSIYVIKEPGPPVRNSATQVPVRHGRTLKFSAPNRCGDEDYENLKEVPWHFKMQEAIFDEMRRNEVEEEQKDNVCPCCEYFADSAIDKKELLEKMRSVLTLPGGNRISESISIAKKIVEEIAANAFDDFYEEGKNKKKVDELLSSFIKEGKASDETLTKETDNNKKIVKCEFLPKKPTSSKSVAQKISESVARRIKLINERIAKRNSLDTDVEKEKDEIELKSRNNEMNYRFSIENSKNLNAEKVSFDTKNTSKDKMVLQVNTSYKEASSSSISFFKWLYGSPKSFSQIIKTSSVKSATVDELSTDILSTDILFTDKLSADTNLNFGLKSSEREVFSIRYTSSAISVNKDTSFETDK